MSTPDTHTGYHDEGSYLSGPPGMISRIWQWASTVDHKKIGVMYLFAVLFMFFLGGMSAIAVRYELLDPIRTVTTETVNAAGDLETVTVTTGESLKELLGAMGIGGDLSGSQIYNRAFTLHGAIMVFMFIIPAIPAALGNFFLPIMLGAKDVAFPRLNLMSWYIYLFGCTFGVLSILLGGVDTGWTFYTPYSTTTDADHWRVVLMVMAAFILGFSSILTGLNFVVTVHKLRAPGMGWFDMPLMIWALYATSIIQVLATPVIGITLLLLVFERLFHIGIFDPALGGDPVLYQHFFWFYSHPVVYVMILPGMGIISEILAVHSRKHIFGYRAIAFSSLGIAGVSFLVWGHHIFTAMGELAAILFSGLTFLVAIPTAIKMFNWIATLYKSSIVINTPMMYALMFLFTFSIGGLTGLPLATLATDLHLHDSYYVVAHFHYVMMGGTVIAFMGGLHHWWPKMFGKMYSEKGGMLGAAVVFIGFNLTFFTQFFLGTQGMPRRYANYVDEFQFLHQLSSVGALLLLVGFLIHLFVFVQSLLAGEKAPPNPWGGLTLEWECESPPIEHNFHKEPLLKHGPYDFETTVPPHWDPKDYPLPENPDKH
ncbi:MAG: cbb3-type cytochrome c oxidase subunit I [Phycisphaerales bacterium]|nr:cbb3-type cytochrome c oxidase subunit I [Phycisphaerales bacterium]